MSLLARWFGARPVPAPALAARLAALPRRADPAHPRWVVVDVETGGLDPRRDALLAVGAVAVSVADGTLRLADHFEVVLRQPVASAPANILVHGIGHAAQTGGMPPATALADFLDYLGDSPLVAFHAAFDATALARACRRELGHAFDWRWLDLAYVAPALLPREQRRSLDDWCARFGIVNAQRHHALADALATAELLLALRACFGPVERDNFDAWRGCERRGRQQRLP